MLHLSRSTISPCSPPGNTVSPSCRQTRDVKFTILSRHQPARRQHRSSWSCMATAGVDTSRYSANGSTFRDSNPRFGTDRDGTMGPQSSVSYGTGSSPSNSSSRPPVTTPVVPGVIKSYRVSLWDAMKFNGPAPEIINGRLAMIGILAGAANEINYSETVLQQVQHVPIRILVFTAIVVYSSLTPILKGAKSEAFGIFTPRAEITNARAAMLGFAALLFLENTSNVPFF